MLCFKLQFIVIFIFRGFQAYLDTGPNYNFPMFQQLVHKVTEMFKNISDKVIEINRILSAEPRLTTVASCISKIQDCEKDKLELVRDL